MVGKAILSMLLGLGLAAVLAACNLSPNTQQGETTVLDGENNIQISGVIVKQDMASGGASTAEIAAAKARVPHQFKKKPPLSLFDFATNWNPGSNR